MSTLPFFIIFAVSTSVLAQYTDPHCPEASSIYPCECRSYAERPYMVCTNITTEDVLESVFSADFPEKNMSDFEVISSTLPELTRNVFGEVSFESIYINTETLQYISDDAFESSTDTLGELIINNCPITSTTFPFENLDNYTMLRELEFLRNNISEFPEIVSDHLYALSITDNPELSVIPQDAFTAIPQLDSLSLSGCGISTIERGAFQVAENLIFLFLDGNQINFVHRTTFSNLTSLFSLSLGRNRIAYLYTETFRELPELEELDLSHNNLISLDHSIFAGNPLLVYLLLNDNSLQLIQPDTFASCPDLSFLSLKGNELTSLVTGSFNGLEQTRLQLFSNQIMSIESNAFGNIRDSAINLQSNMLTELNEFWLLPLIESNNTVNLEDNPLACGCDIAWLFEDSSYETLVAAQCSNGTDIFDLDTEYYQENC